MAEPQAVVYHEVLPENLKNEGYSEFDQLDFLATFQDRAIELGSARAVFGLPLITGRVKIEKSDESAITNKFSW